MELHPAAWEELLLTQGGRYGNDIFYREFRFVVPNTTSSSYWRFDEFIEPNRPRYREISIRESEMYNLYPTEVRTNAGFYGLEGMRGRL